MRWLLTLLFVLYSVQTSAQVKTQEGERVVLMGDSEAFLLSKEFPPLVERDGASFASVVVPGSSVIYWANGGPWGRIEALQPTLLLVALGANDACMGAPTVEREKPFLRRMLQRIGKLDAHRVVWLGPPKIGDRTKFPQAPSGQTAFAALIASQTPFRFLDAREITVGMWQDKLHCSRPTTQSDTSDGCKVWATWAWDSVKRAR